MKKLMFGCTLLLLLLAFSSISSAAPINHLADTQTAIGFDNNLFYLEHKFGDNFTLGYQSVDWSGHEDIYGQFAFSDNLRGIIGNRNFSPSSELYAGLAVTGQLASQCTGYASFVSGNSFSEFQAGANFKLSENLELNVNYHSYTPDWGANKSGAGLGATFKF
ncbi:MAG: hypothetical protein H6Q75_354 [Firmicutes bacterium]|nr:hypothetical protein [Bacillota bacterium]